MEKHLTLKPGDYVQLRKKYQDWWGRRYKKGTRGFIHSNADGWCIVNVDRVSGRFAELPADGLILLTKGENG